MNEVYVIAGGEWLRNNLNAIAAFMGTRTWDSIEKIALTLSVVAVAFMWVQRHNVMDLLGWAAVFVLISLLVNIRTSVQIIDNSDLVKVHRADNVPVGLAMPLSLTTRNLLNKTLQLLAINKAERAEIGVDAATSGIDIRQRHGNQLNIFDLSTGIQGATVSITGGLPLPDARLCGIGGEAQLVKELIHVAVHIR